MFLWFKGKKLVLINCVNCFWFNMCQLFQWCRCSMCFLQTKSSTQADLTGNSVCLFLLFFSCVSQILYEFVWVLA